ncbi:hypothetical protein [Novosphingopyxis sp. YJ-S2-01]|uniref:hypothetical protein n=1 Tax=Novosphingopyxis sp. YJ-S2-01 TaxID=2794021 RepID=UPI0018DBBA25|nr:hypothetical protein [Novosphingopyxis sp. YJ-S2-01]MBH9537547.1 hypothetical protein [Novosphingopyxis sp. YJ-S2-01]
MTDDVKVTQADIGWATSAAQHLCAKQDRPAAIRLLADAFARHRIATEQNLSRLTSDEVVEVAARAIEGANYKGRLSSTSLRDASVALSAALASITGKDQTDADGGAK